MSEKLIRAYGAQRVLFGTDYPMWSAASELEYFFSLDLKDEERELILHKNSEKIFKI